MINRSRLLFNTYVIAICICLLVGCYTTTSLDERWAIQMEIATRDFVVNGDSTAFHELRFANVNGAMRTKQIMFDNFGRWDKAVYPEGKTHPMLVWEDVNLLNNNIVYDVFADGIESNRFSYSSVLVFDNVNQDALSPISTERDTISQFMLGLVKSAIDTSMFYEQYWKMVDPAHWNKLEDFRRRKELHDNMGVRK